MYGYSTVLRRDTMSKGDMNRLILYFVFLNSVWLQQFLTNLNSKWTALCGFYIIFKVKFKCKLRFCVDNKTDFVLALISLYFRSPVLWNKSPTFSRTKEQSCNLSIIAYFGNSKHPTVSKTYEVCATFSNHRRHTSGFVICCLMFILSLRLYAI